MRIVDQGDVGGGDDLAGPPREHGPTFEDRLAVERPADDRQQAPGHERVEHDGEPLGRGLDGAEEPRRASRRVVRGGDILCRLGGEEFVIVMANASTEIAAKVAERTRSAIQEEPFVIDQAGRKISITVSIGVAGRGPDGDADSLYRRADRALYRSKSEGRNRVTADAA